MKRSGWARMATAALVALAAAAGAARAQGEAPPSPAELVRVSAPPVAIAAGGTAEARITLTVLPGWHVNANPPHPDYMIPTTVAISPAHGVSAGAPRYPAPHMVRLSFEQSELFVYDDSFTVVVPLAAVKAAGSGRHVLKGTVGFQSCDNHVCLAPASVPFDLTVEVAGGRTAAAAGPGEPAGAPGAGRGPPAAGTADTSRAGAGGAPGAAPAGRGTGFATAPPAAGGAGAALDNPIARELAGGSWAAFLALFLIGLALNLTPCVYPMIGVTVSIFGARRAAPPLQVFGLAAVYVLGMAITYSALGAVAALTGGLFGAFMQNPWVLVGIGALFLALSLGMFGVYEFQLPPALMARLGGSGATSVAGVFASGLVVGVFAAPCVGPPIVALLAIVGAKGDPLYGFTTFFVLSMGLGAPYLVLGMFSNLIQRLPRSGSWMEWVKHVFGVVLVSLGLFYAALGLLPAWALWVLPAALVAGGVYLGFLDHSGTRQPAFSWLKRAFGAAAVLGGLAIVLTTPRGGIEFRPFDETALRQALASGRPAMLDFSADWCVPCHELERVTFADARVVAATREIAAFQVDLTHYDSPEADAWRKRFGIAGVPTVVFLAPDGREVRQARVEGFLTPERFLERVAVARRGGQQAARE